MLLNIFLSLIIAPSLWAAQFNFDGFLDLNKTPLASESSPKRLYTDYLDIKITAKSAMAVDVASGKILYKKNDQEVLPIASITKLMTAIVFLDHNPGWDKEWHTIPSDRRNGGIIHLNIGEIISLENLFKTALIASDNDSAVALARASGLDAQQFIAAMNAKAKELKMNDSSFSDTTGLRLSNKATVGDVIKLINHALDNQDIRKTTNMSYYEFEVKGAEFTRTVKLRNTDSLLKSYLNVIGGKTGSLEEAGYCLAVKIKGDQGQEIIAVVLGSSTNANRFQDIKAISDWVFFNYQWL